MIFLDLSDGTAPSCTNSGLHQSLNSHTSTSHAIITEILKLVDVNEAVPSFKPRKSFLYLFLARISVNLRAPCRDL